MFGWSAATSCMDFDASSLFLLDLLVNRTSLTYSRYATNWWSGLECVDVIPRSFRVICILYVYLTTWNASVRVNEVWCLRIQSCVESHGLWSKLRQHLVRTSMLFILLWYLWIVHYSFALRAITSSLQMFPRRKPVVWSASERIKLRKRNWHLCMGGRVQEGIPEPMGIYTQECLVQAKGVVCLSTQLHQCLMFRWSAATSCIDFDASSPASLLLIIFWLTHPSDTCGKLLAGVWRFGMYRCRIQIAGSNSYSIW